MGFATSESHKEPAKQIKSFYQGLCYAKLAGNKSKYPAFEKNNPMCDFAYYLSQASQQMLIIITIFERLFFFFTNYNSSNKLSLDRYSVVVCCTTL